MLAQIGWKTRSGMARSTPILSGSAQLSAKGRRPDSPMRSGEPFAWGADIICHSTTKFLSGHGHALGGIVVESGRFDWAQGDRFPSLTEPEPAYHGLKFYENFGDFAFTTKARAVALRDFGPTLSPMNAFLTLTGIESLHVRMDRHVADAQQVAKV